MKLVPVVLCCALLVTRCYSYTVDCNHDVADCDNELSKLTIETDSSSPVPGPSIPKKQDKEGQVINTSDPKLQPRLLNLNVDELQTFANALHNHTEYAVDDKKDELGSDLSDVTLDDDEESPRLLDSTKKQEQDKSLSEQFFDRLNAPFHPNNNKQMVIQKSTQCVEDDVVYKIGDKMYRECEETCVCVPGGHFECVPRCKHPYVRSNKKINDNLCFESPIDECCSIIACATGTTTGDYNKDMKSPPKLDSCRHGNETYEVGSKWNIGCQEVCTCENNSVTVCKPRCVQLAQSDKCINVQDPKDSCCEVQVCDVSQDEESEHVTGKSTSTTETITTPSSTPQTTTEREIKRRPLVLAEPIQSVMVQNTNAQVILNHPNTSIDPIHLLLSDDKGVSFKPVELNRDSLIVDLVGGKDYILKTRETETQFNFSVPFMVQSTEKANERAGCIEDGKFYAVGEEFHIGCTELCECTGPNTRECAVLECPSAVGLELLGRSCVQWAPNPPASPPNCCPRTSRCLSDGTCNYQGHSIPNWSEVPISLTGCEQRCFCENGELDCQDICSPLSPIPPQSLRCPPLHRVAPVNISDEDCCKQWGCVPNAAATKPSTKKPIPFLPTIPPDLQYPPENLPNYPPKPPQVPKIPNYPPIPFGDGAILDENNKLTVISLQAESPTSVKMLFGLPSVLVGLRGSVDLRYTDKMEDDITNWYSQVFAPADEILTTSRLEFLLAGLKPSTTYKIRGKLYLHNLPVEPESEVRTVRTLDLPVVEEKRRDIDTKLSVVDVNDTTAHISWRHFTENELQFIDGVQIRYRPVGTPIFLMTELLHYSRSSAELRDLRPSTRYEAELVMVAPLRANTELHDPTTVEFTTAPYVDAFNWSVSLSSLSMGASWIRVGWAGVPPPPERWVRVFRGAHVCHNQAEGDGFKLAARGLASEILLTGLLADTRCRVWLELFLTNGKIKTSNVLEIHTKTLDEPTVLDNEIEASSIVTDGRGSNRGDYYGALVGVGVVAALGAVTSLLLLLIVVRRHRPRSANITPVPSAPRQSSLPPYDNPAYKLELQQETMDL